VHGVPLGVSHAALTIAGSDSGGGAGIQADLKTFAAFGVFGASAITAVTAQNTLGVSGFQAIDAEMVALQIRTVLADLPISAVKTGMLATAETVKAVIAALAGFPDLPVIVDPVTHAKSGDALLNNEGVTAVRDRLIPRCALVTPNLPEVEALTGVRISNDDDMELAGRRLLELGARAAVVKGGHRVGSADDLFIDHERVVWLRSERILTTCDHGTGCTFSAAVAAGLALGAELFVAVQHAKDYLTEAMRHAYSVGAGRSPVNHLYRLPLELVTTEMERKQR